MPYEFKVTRRVEFSDTDMAGIVHFSNFFRYMETVEHAFWRSLGTSVILPKANPPLGLPRVSATCDYRRPLRFEDVIEIHLLVAERGRRSLTYQIRMKRIEPGPPEEVAVGKLTVVCVRKNPDGRLESVPFPESMAAQIEVAPAELLSPSPRPTEG
jgi:YbgC/YbaW family acyl-CoA thioester hydrolase